MPERIEQQYIVPEELSGLRVDQAAAQLFGDFSRERLKAWIGEGALTLDGETVKPRAKVLRGQLLTLSAELEPAGDWEAQDIALEILFEDEELLVIDKPAGLVVHPAAGNPDGTLLNALLHHLPEQIQLARAGIVHRLDKDTSGLMVVAKSLLAQRSLIEQLKDRSVSREYDAVVVGTPISGGRVDAPIGRHPRDRKRQAVVAGGKPAVTHYRVVERYRAHALVRCKLETGRTHQIRVHMAHRQLPLVGDPVYGGRLKFPAGASEVLKERLRGFSRQALHARRLSIRHPASGETLRFEASPPADLQDLIAALLEDAGIV
ncbi:23S rRNA pseudouridine(1911/1915/1917) synthase RluD [Halotalea alkalilenta]|uniref:Pseudouridine synthase n=1 Tax=Halotalea alkalilenta TaxID=376489 RepID=A0A172YJG5_9GAMM|nr:23S rRNA pseudouridine(1911/1915/1917) synthase RluD [Halotalea alkalilenta]ANF59302.1 RNA pseudouridine synthase [Halotalea alkalilenta]